MSVAGPCEWCGGPQVWTIIRGEVYESCNGGCSPLPGLGLDPPPDSKELRSPLEHIRERIAELIPGEGVGPLEGAAAKMSVPKDSKLPF